MTVGPRGAHPRLLYGSPSGCASDGDATLGGRNPVGHPPCGTPALGCHSCASAVPAERASAFPAEGGWATHTSAAGFAPAAL